MNRKSLAITAGLFAVTLAAPPPINTVMGVPLFVGLKLYRTAVIFMVVSVLLYAGPLIGLLASNPLGRIEAVSLEIAESMAESTMQDPSGFPYGLVSFVTMIGVELGVILGLFVFPAWIIRRKVYPHVRNALGHSLNNG